MAGYIPWYGKKRERLATRIKELRELMAANADEDQIAKAAEFVRDAKIRSLKAARSRIPPSEKRVKQVDKLGREVQQWVTLPIADILSSINASQSK